MNLDPKIRTATMRDMAYTSELAFYRYTSQPDIEPVLPPPAPNGQTRMYGERSAVLLTMALDLVRVGIKFPLAASWAVRIAEQLWSDPEADTIHLEFRRNGALFFFTTDDAPEAAEAAGPARWRMTFDLSVYREAFRQAVQAEAGEHVLA